MQAWHEDPLNQQHLDRLRVALGDNARLLVFLGAGLSFGAGRRGDRTLFDDEHWKHELVSTEVQEEEGGEGPSDRMGGPPRGPQEPYERAFDDDGRPLPSWPWLVSRMRRRLALQCPAREQPSLNKFFRDQTPLDCAQLFRQSVGEQNYREFLTEQFATRGRPGIGTTPSHEALVRLQLSLMFTTNFDELIETAFLEAGQPLRVSADEPEFMARLAERPAHHLVKLHGSIDRPPTVVLTRDDYASARSARREMFAHLRAEMAQASFLFVGFSLSDPNFGAIQDDIRDSLAMMTPVSYTVQGRRDPVKERYLSSMGVNTVWLDGWSRLPDFLDRLRPHE